MLQVRRLEKIIEGRSVLAIDALDIELGEVVAVIQYTRTSYTLQLDDKQQTLIPLSKQSEKELQELLGY